MITQNEIALKILNMGKDGYKNDAEGFEKLNQANDLIKKHVQEQLRLYVVSTRELPPWVRPLITIITMSLVTVYVIYKTFYVC